MCQKESTYDVTYIRDPEKPVLKGRQHDSEAAQVNLVSPDSKNWGPSQLPTVRPRHIASPLGASVYSLVAWGQE